MIISMQSSNKHFVSFVLALSLHLTILVLFGIGYYSESEEVPQKPVPEIIQASVLEDEKIMEEAERLKANEINKQIAQQQQQQTLENQRKKEQTLLENTRKKRLQEEKKAQALAEKRKQQEIKDKQEALLKKQRAEEAAKLAKIKLQKAEEKKRQEQKRIAEEKKKQDEIRKAEEKKRELAKLEEQKKQHALIAKRKAEQAQKTALLKQQAAAAKAKALQDGKAVISYKAAIQRKVNNNWIRPLTSKKGLKATVRVKLLPSGDVMSADVIKTSSDNVFDRSAENAVRKASPLPVPKDRALFSKKFRTFTFVFKPD